MKRYDPLNPQTPPPPTPVAASPAPPVPTGHQRRDRAGKVRQKARTAKRDKPRIDPREALERAVSFQTTANYGAIFEGFMKKGIPEADIKPRENVFTFHAWIALKRVVKKGEHGVKIISRIPPKGQPAESAPTDESTEPSAPSDAPPATGRFVTSTVFHISQTKPLEEASTTAAPAPDPAAAPDPAPAPSAPAAEPAPEPAAVPAWLARKRAARNSTNQ